MPVTLNDRSGIALGNKPDTNLTLPNWLTQKVVGTLVGTVASVSMLLGGWALAMQVSLKSDIAQLITTVKVNEEKRIEKDEAEEKRWADQVARDKEVIEALDERIDELEAWGPKHGPIVTSKDLDDRLEVMLSTTNILNDRLVEVVEKLSDTMHEYGELLARFDERLKQVEKDN